MSEDLSPGRRRELIVDAAIRIIARRGLEAATTEEISREAGIPLGALHYAFGTRIGLIRAVAEQVTDHERVTAWLSLTEEDIDASPLVLVRAALNSYVSALESAPDREAALFEITAYAIRNDRVLLRDQNRTFREHVSNSLRFGAELAGVEWQCDVDGLGDYVVMQLDGLTMSWLATRDTDAARRRVDFIAESVARYAVACGMSRLHTFGERETAPARADVAEEADLTATLYRGRSGRSVSAALLDS